MKISVIIPCFKASKSISKAIGSILDQDYKDFEIICVLDGPDKDAERVIKAYSEVKCLQIPHGGACKARNEGFKASTGEIVLFSDADCYWNPGIFRTFIETFEKNPQIDIVYGGYRFIQNNKCHVPLEFDPYMIEIFNYIDTGNPVKREWVEKVGGFDEKLKRYQDWDLWIRIIRAGAKGKKIDSLTRETDLPTEDSISGKDNYEEAFHVVKRKNNIPYRNICVTSLAAEHHGLRVAKMCGWDYWNNTPMLPQDYKAIYLLGCFPESIQQHVGVFLDARTKGKRENTKMLIHWIGTDVLHLQTLLPWIQIKNIRKMFDKHGVIHLCQSKQNQAEMEEMGFKVKVLPLPVNIEYGEYAKPEEFTVACYDHGGVDQKWHKWAVMEIAKAMPDVKFIFFGNKQAIGKENNCEWIGHVPIDDVIRRSSCLLRLTIHDGYPVAPIEFMARGRKVITNVPDMRYTNYVDMGVVTEERTAEIKSQILKEIRTVQKLPDFGSQVYDKMIEHYSTHLSPERFKKEIEDIVEF